MNSEINKRIRLFAPTFAIEECLLEIRDCMEIGWTGAGFKTTEFENLWNAFTGANYSLFLNSNTSGLEIATSALRTMHQWCDKSEIITSPLTFVSSNHAILRAGLVPRFADIDDSFCLDPDSIRKLITQDTVAVMYVGIGGNTGQLLKTAALCKEFGLKLILDAAHMAGTSYEDKTPFTEIADVVVYSFQAVKNLPTGDSGLISTNDKNYHSLFTKLSWLGINASTFDRNEGKLGYKWLYDVEELGFKANGNSIMAAIAKVQLKYLDSDNARRRELANLYRFHLEKVGEISFPQIYEEIVSSQHLFQIRVPAEYRADLIDYLNQQGIDVGVHYRLNTHYRMYSDSHLNNTNAAKIELEVLSLPLHIRLSNQDVETVVKEIGLFFSKRAI